MWTAKVRNRTKGGEWVPVTSEGIYYYVSDKQQIEELLMLMRSTFPQNEYKIEEFNG